MKEKTLKKKKILKIKIWLKNANPNNKENIFKEFDTIKEEEIKLKEKDINGNNDILNKEKNISEKQKELNE